jgi:hypothetical protein
MKIAALNRRILSTMLVGVAMASIPGCVEELGSSDESDVSDVSETESEARVKPTSCTKEKFAAAGVAAASAIPYIGASLAVVSELIGFTSYLGGCGLTIEEVMRSAKIAANQAVVDFAKSELAAIDRLIQDDQVINLAKLEARFTLVFSKIEGLANLDYTTTPAVAAAATVAMSLQFMKLQVAHFQRRGYIQETKNLASVVIKGYLTKKADQFNQYWNNSSTRMETTFVINPPRVDYLTFGYITYPDKSKETLSKRYGSSDEQKRDFAAYQRYVQDYLAGKRKAAYDSLFVNSPYKTLMDTLPKMSSQANNYLSLAFRRPAAQSSNSSLAALAVDSVMDDARTAKTANEVNPWWQVDLGLTSEGALVPFKGISIFFQKGTRRWQAVVEVLNNRNEVVWSKAIDSTIATHIYSTGNVEGRYCRLRLTNGTKDLSLSEFYVWPR